LAVALYAHGHDGTGVQRHDVNPDAREPRGSRPAVLAIWLDDVEIPATGDERGVSLERRTVPEETVALEALGDERGLQLPQPLAVPGKDIGRAAEGIFLIPGERRTHHQVVARERQRVAELFADDLARREEALGLFP